VSSSTGTVGSPAWTLRHYRERGGGAGDPAAAVPVSAGGFAIESSVSNFVVCRYVGRRGGAGVGVGGAARPRDDRGQWAADGPALAFARRRLGSLEVFQSCRECENCLAGEYRRRKRHGLTDMYGFISVDRVPELWGSYAESQYLAPDSMVLPVPRRPRPGSGDLVQPARCRNALESNGSRKPSGRRGTMADVVVDVITRPPMAFA